MVKWLTVLRSMYLMPKRYFGAILGGVTWVIIEIFGFFPALLLALLILIGYALGRIADGRANWQGLIERWWDNDRFD